MSFVSYQHLAAVTHTLLHWHCRNFALRSWEETVPTFKYNPAVPYSHIFVPTADTVRFGALLTLALQVQRPVLLTGTCCLFTPGHPIQPTTQQLCRMSCMQTSGIMLNLECRTFRQAYHCSPWHLALSALPDSQQISDCMQRDMQT